VIDAEGNASFSGQLTALSVISNQLSATNATISGTLTASEASLSGNLVAGNVEAPNINAIKQSVSSVSQSVDSVSLDINDIQKLLADIKNQPIPDSMDYQNIDPNMVSLLNGFIATNSTIAQQWNNGTMEQLTVTGNTNLYNISVSGSILVGNTMIEDNSIISLASELKLSALSTINLFDGAVIIAKDGKITIRGEIIAKGGIRTDEIKALTNEGQVSIKNLTINNLTFDKISTNSAIIVAADNFAQNGIFAPAIETATASAGIGILPESSSEVVIYNSLISPTSLIYLTPISHISPITLSVGQKEGCPQQSNNEAMKQCKKYFKVITNTQSTLPVKFNWLIIN